MAYEVTELDYYYTEAPVLGTGEISVVNQSQDRH